MFSILFTPQHLTATKTSSYIGTLNSKIRHRDFSYFWDFRSIIFGSQHAQDMIRCDNFYFFALLYCNLCGINLPHTPGGLSPAIAHAVFAASLRLRLATAVRCGAAQNLLGFASERPAAQSESHTVLLMLDLRPEYHMDPLDAFWHCVPLALGSMWN
jgi:hypothetical protein